MNKILNIWLQPVYARLNSESKKSLYIVFALFPVAAEIIASILYFWGTKTVGLQVFAYAFLWSIAALIATLLSTWFAMLVQNIGLQYSPANAGLVPCLKKHLQAAMILPIVFCALLAFIIFRIAMHQYSMWPSFVLVLLMAFFAIIVRSQWAVLPMILCFQMPAIFERAGLKHIDQMLEQYLGIPVELMLLLAMPLIIYAAMTWTFSSRDDALFKMHARSVALKAGMAGGRMNENLASLSLASVFLRWMQFSIDRSKRKNSDRLATARLHGFVFGPRLHWMTITLQVVAMLTLGILAVFLLDMFSMRKDGDFVRGFGFGFGSVLLIAQPLLFCILLFYTLYQTRGEQALLGLTARAAQPLLQNRLLTRYLLRQFFILYGMSLSIAIAAAVFVLDSAIKIGSMTLFVTCLFPLVFCVVLNHAAMKTVSDHPMLKILLACLILFCVGMALQLWVASEAVWGYCAFVLLATSGLLLHRLRANAGLTMFPVGRAA
jgi:hypothetical protein